MTDIYRARYKRLHGTINGAFTLFKNDKPFAPFIDMPGRSGQNGFADTDWHPAKSPIPIGEYYLWMECYQPGQYEPAPHGIGEFHPISSGLHDHAIIQNPLNPEQIRQSVGQHPENALPGSAGCQVLVHDSLERKHHLIDLFHLYATLKSEGIQYIKYVVSYS